MSIAPSTPGNEQKSLDGNTLREELARNSPFPDSRAVDIALGVLHALDYMHGQGYVHGSVNPDNIRLLADGHIQLAPSVNADERELHARQTSYQSPEQISSQPIDARSDLFSVGVVLYEMLTGKRPFRGDSVTSVGYAITHFEPPRELEISGALWTVLTKALAKEPQDRFCSAQEFSSALQQVQPAELESTWRLANETEAVPQRPKPVEPPKPKPTKEPVAVPTEHPQRASTPIDISGVFTTKLEPPKPSTRVPLPPVSSRPQLTPEQMTDSKGCVAGFMVAGIIALIVFIGSMIGVSSDRQTDGTQDVESTYEPVTSPLPTKTTAAPEQSPIPLDVLVELPGGETVSMPTEPSKVFRRMGSENAYVCTATNAGAAYVAGTLMGVSGTTNQSALNNYARMIAHVESSDIDQPKPIKLHGHGGSKITFRSKMGKQKIYGIIEVYENKGRITFFGCKWPFGLGTTYNSHGFFGSIKL